MNLNFFSSNFTGTSVIIVANFFESKPKSILDSILSFSLPLTLSRFLKRFSISPNSLRNFLAVLSPTPGNPGILSTLSPIMPR